MSLHHDTLEVDESITIPKSPQDIGTPAPRPMTPREEAVGITIEEFEPTVRHPGLAFVMNVQGATPLTRSPPSFQVTMATPVDTKVEEPAMSATIQNQFDPFAAPPSYQPLPPPPPYYKSTSEQDAASRPSLKSLKRLSTESVGRQGATPKLVSKPPKPAVIFAKNNTQIQHVEVAPARQPESEKPAQEHQTLYPGNDMESGYVTESITSGSALSAHWPQARHEKRGCMGSSGSSLGNMNNKGANKRRSLIGKVLVGLFLFFILVAIGYAASQAITHHTSDIASTTALSSTDVDDSMLSPGDIVMIRRDIARALRV